MWHYKNLGDAMLAGSQLEQIKQSADDNMSLLVRYVTKNDLYCEVIVYFPPTAKKLAKQYLASPCLAPKQQDLTAL